VRLNREAGNKKVIVYIYQNFDKKTPYSSLISGTWTRENADTQEQVGEGLCCAALSKAACVHAYLPQHIHSRRAHGSSGEPRPAQLCPAVNHACCAMP